MAAPLRLLGLLVGLAILAVACTRVTFEGTEHRLIADPQDLADLDPAELRGVVVWGGRILEIENFASGTELLVLAVPLSQGNVPRTDERSVGRFVAVHSRYLEPLDFAPGRYVSLAGHLDGVTEAWQLEGRAVAMPQVAVNQIHLWPRDPSRWQTRFSFGVGVNIHH
jgi:outer membrane lipoprotein